MSDPLEVGRAFITERAAGWHYVVWALVYGEAAQPVPQVAVHTIIVPAPEFTDDRRTGVPLEDSRAPPS